MAVDKLGNDTVINWTHLSELRADMGDETFAEVINLFLQEVQSGIERLSRERSASDLVSEFHMLKGSALSLGLTDLANICANAESMANAGQVDCFQPDELSTVFHTSRSELLSQIPALAV